MARDEWRKLRQQLEKQGCHFKRGGTGHIKAYQGRRLLTSMPSSPSDRYAIRNARAHFRRLGFEIT
jgi:hypothetical protein